MKPFHKDFQKFLFMVIIYEAVQIVESYVLPGTMRLINGGYGVGFWALFLGSLLFYDELFLRFDNYLDKHILLKHRYPIMRFLRVQVLEKFLKLDVGWHQDNNSSVLSEKVSRGVDHFRDMLETLSWEFVPTTIQVLLTVGTLFFITGSWLIAGIILVSFSLFIYLTMEGTKRRQPIREQRQDLGEEGARVADEAVRSVETVIMFGQRERLLEGYNSLYLQIADLGKQDMLLGVYVYNRWRQRILAVSRRGLLALWVWQVSRGRMNLATLVYVHVLSEKVFASFWRFARLIERAVEASESIKRLIHLMEQEPQIVDHPQACIPPTSAGVSIKFQDVAFAYDGDRDTISNLNMEIEQGQIVALVGPSGAGKTTLRKLVVRIREACSGKVLINNQDVRLWPQAKLRELFSYVPQGDDVAIYDDTIRANITFGKPNATEDELIAAVKMAGLHSFICTLLAGFETKVGERGVKLSGGQKQRVALARAFITNRPVLILDEATNSLDALTEFEIQSQLKPILKGKTAIIIAHRLSTIRDIADKIIVLKDGTKLEEGTHTELVKKSGLYAQLVHAQTHAQDLEHQLLS